MRKEGIHLRSINPSTPILIREFPNEEARLVATYKNGRERTAVVNDMDTASVVQELQRLVAAGNHFQ